MGDKAAADRVSALRPAGLDLEANAAWKEVRERILLEAREVERNLAPCGTPRLWDNPRTRWRGEGVGVVGQISAQEWDDGERWKGHGKGDARRRFEAVGDKAEAARVGALRLAGLAPPDAMRLTRKC